MSDITEKSEMLREVSNMFQLEGLYEEGYPYGDGHINETYKVTTSTENQKHHYILQKMNHKIFTNPEELMENVQQVTNYLRNIRQSHGMDKNYDVLELIYTKDGRNHTKDHLGNYWRVYKFIEGTISYTFTEDNNILYEAGKAFGLFQWMLEDYPALTLHDTIKDFHNTRVRYNQLMEAIEKDLCNRKKSVTKEINFCIAHEKLSDKIMDALVSGEIPYRVTLNDTKLNNVLINEKTGKGQCVIDLDTVMSGSALFDYGDAIRSCISTAPEDESDLNKVQINLERFESYTKGYLETVGKSLNEAEINMLPYAGIIMTLECGMRFLVDHLNGDVYFRIHRENHNLDRARNQFKVVEEMEKQLPVLESIIKIYMNKK